MSAVIKLRGNQITLPTTANTVGGAVAVRLSNKGASAHVVTQAGSQAASFTLLPGTDVIVAKTTTDTLAVDSGTDVVAVSVAFTN